MPTTPRGGPAPPRPRVSDDAAVVGGFAWLIGCQAAGEVAVRALGLSVPGPVVGMALLFGALVLRGDAGPGLRAASGTLLRHLSLFFVPAAVGVARYADLLRTDGLALAAGVLVSTALTLAVTAWVFAWASRGTRGHGRGAA